MAASRNGTKKTVLTHEWCIENHHCHVSSAGFFLGTLFDKHQPVILPEAASRNLKPLCGDGGTGWSKANKINLWACLLDGTAPSFIGEQSNLNPRNLDTLNEPFQIDGNFGATSGMAKCPSISHWLHCLLPASRCLERRASFRSVHVAT